MARATVLKRFELSPEAAASLETYAKETAQSQTAAIEWACLDMQYPLAPRRRIGAAIDLIMSDGFEAGMEILAELAGRDRAAIRLAHSAEPVSLAEIASRPNRAFCAPASPDVQTESKAGQIARKLGETIGPAAKSNRGKAKLAESVGDAVKGKLR